MLLPRLSPAGRLSPPHFDNPVGLARTVVTQHRAVDGSMRIESGPPPYPAPGASRNTATGTLGIVSAALLTATGPEPMGVSRADRSGRASKGHVHHLCRSSHNGSAAKTRIASVRFVDLGMDDTMPVGYRIRDSDTRRRTLASGKTSDGRAPSHARSGGILVAGSRSSLGQRLWRSYCSTARWLRTHQNLMKKSALLGSQQRTLPNITTAELPELPDCDEC